MIAEIADHFVEHHGARICFIGLAENVHDSDREGSAAVMDRMRTGSVSDTSFFAADDPIEAFSMVASMDYVISQRLHPTVIAWRAGKPCVAFDYQFHKTVDFMDSIGMGAWVLRTDEYSLKRYLELYERLSAERSKLAHRAHLEIEGWRARQFEFAVRALRLIR
jgi:polysaccharide pyruvyl transferase WcaK-like protein